ncbi:MAG: hypothetical protein SP4CHLAM5_09650 [Chlamydiia bacterium]|nr:hypothetical protein [Chlamydiia bacterium]MCH9618823.1 hypothetical protein [Chlamydiia bacterium]MCH9624375.1 hypothetical protein [Chlamydiia bacterium]
MGKNRERVEGAVGSEEIMKMIKEVYQDFNKVLKECNDSEKFSAIIKINLLNETFKNYMEALDGSQKIPTKMLLEELDKNTNVPAVKELYEKIGEVEKVMDEANQLMIKHSPVKVRAKVDKSRSKMRRMGRNKIKD